MTLNALTQLYAYMSNQSTPEQAHERTVGASLDEVASRAVEQHRKHVFSSIFPKGPNSVHFLDNDGTIYSTPSASTDNADETAKYLADLQHTLQLHGLKETPASGMFLLSGSYHFQFSFDLDEYRAKDVKYRPVRSKESFEAWAEEIQHHQGILAYCHLQTGVFGKQNLDKMNWSGYSDAIFDFVTPTQTHLVARLPQEITLDQALATIPSSVSSIDIAPFKLLSREIFNFGMGR